MVKEEKKTIAQVICGAVCGVIMMLCTLVYLILGFTIGWWHPGWILFVAGGITCGIIGTVVNTTAQIKQIKKDEAENENKEDK